MARLLMLVILALALVALAGFAVSALTRATREARSLGQEIALTTRGTSVQKIAYAALFILMLGVTSGLLGGL
ncbi:hypothetical protein [Roseovarius sp.]|uniref:hypothetical protein n=1 Tax=Roseovarius sp. TaxID=1486281 RepID=UPI003BA9872F